MTNLRTAPPGPSFRLGERQSRPSLGTVAWAAGVVLAGGADWVAIGRHTTSAAGSIGLVALTVAQLVLAGLVATRPSRTLIRRVATAGLAVGLWSVLSQCLAGSTATMVDVLAFSAQLATAASGWLILAGADRSATSRR